jgi:hypothetical protein
MLGSRGMLVLNVAVLSLLMACGDSSGPKTAPPASLVVVSGDRQPAPEVGMPLPLPLTVKVLDAQGQNLAGVAITWAAVSGSTSTTSTTTDAKGLSSVQWTLGTQSGSQTATATVTGLKPVTFTATAVAGPLTQMLLSRDTVSLLTIGDSFRFNARGADKYGNTVQTPTVIESADPSIVTADNFGSGAILIARATDKTTTISAKAGTISKMATVIVLPPPCVGGASPLSLAVGEVATLSGANASEFCVQGTASGAQFLAIPYFGDFAGSLLRVSISSGGTTTEANFSQGIAPRLRSIPRASTPLVQRDEEYEARLMERSRTELTPRMEAARRARLRASGTFGKSVAVPVIGDILKLNTNSSSPCSNPNLRTGRVVAITNRAIVVSDTTNPANGFATADFEDFGASFDTLIYPTDTANFGGPSDIDKNQRVILFFTRAVNELTPPGSSFYVGGFFFSRDLFPTQTGTPVEACPASNVAELVYLLVPDPSGAINQNERSKEFVKAVTLSSLAHEFQHLINASRHLYVNTASATFEDRFLDEGLAHIAEELVFFRASGLAPGQNLNYQQVESSPRVKNAFDDFAVANFRRFSEFLINPLTNSPYANNTNLTTRGAIWSFLRYAADRRGGNESQMWFQLVNPPATVHGVSNITRAVTPDLDAWVRDWAIATYADDFIPGMQANYTHPSWNMRSVVEVVNEGMWLLATQELATTAITSVGISGGSSAYLRFGVKADAVGGGRITSRGGAVPSGFAISILRTK